MISKKVLKSIAKMIMNKLKVIDIGHSNLSIDEFLERAYIELNTCIAKSKHCYRIFNVATVKDGNPEIRSVVLRQLSMERIIMSSIKLLQI